MAPGPHDRTVLQTGQIAAAGLDWWVMAGLDTIVEDQPRRWLAEPMARPAAAPAVPAPAPVAPRAAAVIPLPRAPAVAAAPELAGIADLDTLLARLAMVDHPLARPDVAPQLLTGDIASGIIVIADQPDAADSPAARLATRMLAAIGAPPHARAHLLPWPTAGGRKPSDEEVAFFAPWLARALELAAPRLVLAFGDRAAALTGVAGGIARLRGRWLTLGLSPAGDSPAPLLATFHPRSLLTQPELKRLAWADLQSFAERLEAR